jgi:serine/threonine protein kinase
MNRFCERCERVTADGHLWCERPDCPAEQGFPVFVYGDYLGDLKITKLIRVWRTAALYEALRGKETVLLKVAHKGDDCEERLKREAVALASLVSKPLPPVALVQSYFPSPRPILPVPLPPYPVPSSRPYGELSYRGETKFFTVFQHAQGKILSDLLLENPQMWHYQVAWITVTVAEALRPLAAGNRCHLCLSPDMILVDVDKEGILRPLIFDLGFLLTGNEIESVYEWQKLCEPGYTAPELLTKRPKSVTPAADVYSLGSIFFEMLSGQTVFDSKLLRDEQIREAVTQHRGNPPVERPELEHAGVVKVVEQALAATGRHNNVIELANALIAIYGRSPAEKRPYPRRMYVLLISLAVLLVATLGVAAFILLQILLRR